MKSRAAWLDVLRVVMAVQMMQGHTIDVVWRESERSGAGFEWWQWARGLTAASFLFAAGITHRVRPEPAPWLRALGLVLLGYSLRFPLSLLVGSTPTQTEYDAARIVDILQCIGVLSLLNGALTAERFGLGSMVFNRLLGVSCVERLRGVVTLSTCLCFAAFAPMMARLDFPQGAEWASNYLNRNQGSLFPLFPWASYYFAGAFLRPWLVRNSERIRWQPPLVLSATAGCCALVATGLECARNGAAGAAISEWYSMGGIAFDPGTDPALIASRLGWVCALCALLATLTTLHDLPGWATAVAKSTLVLYLVHLWILYVPGIGLRDRLGQTLSLSTSLAVTTAVILASVAAAFVYRELRSHGSQLRPWSFPIRGS